MGDSWALTGRAPGIHERSLFSASLGFGECRVPPGFLLASVYAEAVLEMAAKLENQARSC